MSKDKPGWRMVGFSIPDRLFQRINLQGLASGYSRSRVLRMAVNTYVEEIKSDEAHYCKILIDRYQQEYLRMRTEDVRPLSLPQFRAKVAQELQDKKVDKTWVDIICKGITE